MRLEVHVEPEPTVSCLVDTSVEFLLAVARRGLARQGWGEVGRFAVRVGRTRAREDGAHFGRATVGGVERVVQDGGNGEEADERFGGVSRRGVLEPLAAREGEDG